MNYSIIFRDWGRRGKMKRDSTARRLRDTSFLYPISGLQSAFFADFYTYGSVPPVCRSFILTDLNISKYGM